MKRGIYLLLPWVALLAGCVDDAASYLIDGKDHALTIIREQPYFWKKTVTLDVVAARLPDCQRRHKITTAPLNSQIELWQAGPETYLLQVGDKVFLSETQTCEGFRRLDGPPPGGMGTKLGVFRDQGQGQGLRFQAAPAPANPAPGAAPGTGSGAGVVPSPSPDGADGAGSSAQGDGAPATTSR